MDCQQPRTNQLFLTPSDSLQIPLSLSHTHTALVALDFLARRVHLVTEKVRQREKLQEA